MRTEGGNLCQTTKNEKYDWIIPPLCLLPETSPPQGGRREYEATSYSRRKVHLPMGEVGACAG